MQAVSPWDIIVTDSAEPDAGANGYSRTISAPAIHERIGMPGTLLHTMSTLASMLRNTAAVSGTGQQVEGGGQAVAELDRRLALPAPGQSADDPHALDRILDVTGHREPGRGELVAHEIVGVLTQVDRHGDADLLEVGGVVGVVAGQAADHRGEEGVVDAAVGHLAGPAEILDRHLQHTEAPGQAPAVQHR